VSAQAQLDEALVSIEADKETITLQLNQLAELRQDILAMTALREQLERDLKTMLQRAETSDRQIAAEKEISVAAKAQVALLNRQIAALRDQMQQLNAALEVSEARDREQKAQISDLGKRLNVALAGKVQELARYRSEFFGRLREVLGDRPDIQIVGDRFIFQSEVLFESGSAEIGLGGGPQLAQLARTLTDISNRIPEDIDWILRVDGHTDRVPIRNERFRSNWELSTARAISVVRFLIRQGIPATRLAATGFGEYQPIDDRTAEIAFRRNRRIELKLTER
jgi:chemotaxis protein MotB